MAKHKWEPVGFVPVLGTRYQQSVFQCVNCNIRRTSEEMGDRSADQDCRWGDLDPDEPIMLPDDPRLTR